MPNVPSLTPKSRATAAIGFLVSSTIRTAPSRNSRSYFALLVDISILIVDASTLRGEPQALSRRTPTQAYTARTKATPAKPAINVHYRVRRDRVDTGGVITIRYDSQLRHIGLGREHAGTRVLALIADRDIRVVNADTGELLRELTLDTTKDYQPLGRKPGPQTKT